MPVLVGAGQVLQRDADPATALEPLALMQHAAERAADDAGARDLLARLDAIYVPQGVWRYTNPAVRLAERLGSPKARTGLGIISGSTVQVMISRACRDVAAGRCEVVLVVGGESERTKRRAAREGVDLSWTEQGADTPEPDERFGGSYHEFGWWEKRFRPRPIQAFSLYENAIRRHSGEGLADHRRRIARLWAGFATVARRNPYAWIQDGPTADTIATPTEDNPMVAYPYTKRMVANMVVDQAAAVIVCSAEAARRYGVAPDRFVHPRAATDAARSSGVPVRPEYHEEPAIGIAGRRALDLAGARPEDCAYVDLYSCFPSAVQIGAAEIGFDLARELTVTGGLTFAGGPFNSYVLHAIATMMDRLRADPGSLGFVSSVGGYMTKVAAAVYGTEPAPSGFVHECLDDVTEALPSRVCLEEYEGPAEVETYAVMPGRDGGEATLLFACRTPDDERAWATSQDADLVCAVSSEELLGRSGSIRDGSLAL